MLHTKKQYSFVHKLAVSLLTTTLLLGLLPMTTLAEDPLTFLTDFGSSGSGNGRFNRPEGILIRNDILYVVDRNNSRVQLFDTAGNFDSSWSSSLAQPVGIAAITDNLFYATTNNGVRVFDSGGQLSFSFSEAISTPVGIALDGSSNAYVVDSEANLVHKFSGAGTYLFSWGGEGDGEGEFVSPSGIAIDSSNRIYVVDTGNDRVQRFDNNGTFQTTFGRTGSDLREFNNPTGIAIDDADNTIYVVDTGNWRVQKFTSSNAYLTEWSLEGASGNTNSLQGIALDSTGRVYVTDAVSNRVQVFGIPNLTFDSPSYDVAEDAGTVTLTANLNLAAAGPVSFSYSTTPNTATSDEDYETIVNQSVTITTGQTTAAFTVAILSDDLREGNESFSVSLSNLSGATLGDIATAEVTIIDGDIPGIFVEPDSLTLNEPSDSGSFSIRLNTVINGDVFINLSTGSDECTVSPNPVVISTGEALTGVPITVNVVDDTAIDGTQSCDITTAAIVSSDSAYNGLNPDDVAVSVTDDEFAAINLNPTELTVTELGGNNAGTPTATFSINLNNTPAAEVSVALAASNDECTVSPSLLTLTPNNAVSGVAATVTAVADDNIDGTQSCQIVTGNTSSNDANFNGLSVPDVSVTVQDNGSGPNLQVSPTSLSYRQADNEDITLDPIPPLRLSLVVSNIGEGELAWNYRVEDLPWLRITRLALAEEGLIVELNEAVNDLTAGVYTGTIIFTAESVDGSIAANSPQAIPITLEVFTPDPSNFVLSETELTFSGNLGQPSPAAQSFSLSNSNPEATLSWSASTTSDWLSLSQTSGSAPSTVAVSVDTSRLALGSYTDTITLISPQAENSPQTIVVNLEVSLIPDTPILRLSQTEFTFAATINQGNPLPQSLSISNVGEGTLQWTASEESSWLRLSQTSGSAPSTLNLSVETAGLAVGSYEAVILVTGADALDSPQTVAVSLTVSEPVQETGLNLSPQTLTFNGVVSQTDVPTQTISLTEFGIDPLAWIVSESTAWLDITPRAGLTPAEAVVTVDGTGLAVGSYTSTIEFIAPDAPNSPQTVAVLFIVEPPILRPNLHLSKHVSADSLTELSPLTYTLTISNDGQATATNVELRDLLPSGGTVLSTDGVISETGGFVQWTDLSVAVGQTITRTLQISPTITQGRLTNTAVILLDTTPHLTATAVTTLAVRPAGVIVSTEQETELPLDSGGGVIRFPVSDEPFEVRVESLAMPSQSTANEQLMLTNAEATACDTYELGQTFHLTANSLEGETRTMLTASPSTVELLVQTEGGAGNDTLFGLAGSDILQGQAGNDTLFGNGGDDILIAGDGADALHGGTGNDRLNGDAGNDELFGDGLCDGGGADILNGGAGNDTLFGEAGDDQLIGGAGDDQLIGGAGADTYVISADEGTDVIVSFADGEDKIGLPIGLSFADVSITPSDTGTTLSIDDRVVAILLNVDSSLLDATDFTLDAARTGKQITTTQIDTEVYLFYWDGTQWVDAVSTCDTTTGYTRTSSRITVPVCTPGEFTLLNVTTEIEQMTTLPETVYLPLVIR